MALDSSSAILQERAKECFRYLANYQNRGNDCARRPHPLITINQQIPARSLPRTIPQAKGTIISLIQAIR